MKNRTAAIYCILFVLILSLPLLLFGNQDAKSVVKENRTLNQSVSVPRSIAEINGDFTQQIERYFSDHLGFRNTLVSLSNSVRVKILGANTVTSKVIEGSEGWLFYNPQGVDGDPLGDYLGTHTYSQADLQRISDYLVKVRDVCRAAGSEFYLILCPNKASVYGDLYLPGYLGTGVEKGRAELLYDYLRENTDIPCVYSEDELKSYRGTEYMYFKHDTHWTTLGAYLSYRQWYYQYSGELLPPLEDCKKLIIEEHDDLSQQLGITLPGDIYYRADFGRDISYTEQCNEDGSCFTRSTNRNGKKALMFRDSFLIYMQPYICQDFEYTDIYVSQIGEEELALIQCEKPAVVILEMVERYLPE